MAKFTNILDNIISKSKKDNILNTRALASLNWFRNKVASLNRNIRPADFFEEKNRLVSKIELGRMYNFRYDPRTKDKLPYYDIFPLCIPFRPVAGGFLGLNLHYLKPNERAIFLSKLMELERKDEYGNLRIRFNYNTLISATKYKWFRPCIKRYYFAHIRSKYVLIDENEWNVAVFLPTEQFIKAKKLDVWEDSSIKAEGK